MTKRERVFTVFLFLLIVCMVVPSFAGGGQSASGPARTGPDPNFNPTGLPIVKEMIALNFAACRPAGFLNDMKDMKVFHDYEPGTNIRINWIEIEEAAWTEKTSLMLSSNDLPDAFWGWPITDNIVLTYGEQGILIPLENMIDAYAVNMLKGIEEVPGIRPAMTYPNGHIYAIPMQNIGGEGVVQNYPWINVQWLAAAGKNMPATTEELYDVLKAFRALYPNGIPMSFQQYNANGTPNTQFSILSMFGSFGVLDNERHLMIDAKGDILFTPSLPGYLEAVRYFNRLAREGLLDPESFSQNLQQLQGKTRSETGVGLTFGNMINFHIDWSDRPQGYEETLDDYYAADVKYRLMPGLSGPNGQPYMHGRMAGIQGADTNRFMITNICKYPEAALRWVDLFCDNGVNANNIRLGPQGMFWQFGADGMREQLNPPVGTEQGVSYGPANYCVWWWLPSSWVVSVPSQQYQNMTGLEYKQYLDLPNLPPIKFAAAELERLSQIQIDLFRYVESSLVSFVLNGVTDVQWNDYLTRLRAYNMDAFVQIYRTGYDRATGR